MDYLETGKNIVKEDLYRIIRNAWLDVVGEVPPSNYSVLIWGSTIRKNVDEPTDLDIIIEYNGSELSENKKSSIESIIESRAYVKEFEYVDPLVIHQERTASIIANSRVSRAYNVGIEEWETFE